MPIFSLPNKKEVLFVHIPKNGGTSIEQSFKNFCVPKLLTPGPPPFLNCSPQHLTIKDLCLLGFKPKEFDYSFAVVRNPYKRIESEYFYNIHIKASAIDFKTSTISHVDHEEPRGEDDFSNWVINNLNSYKHSKNHSDNHFIPQCEFVDDTVNDIFALEDGLKNILDKISAKIGLTLPNEHRFKTDKFSVMWSEEAIRLTNEIYGNDFKLFGYEEMK